MPGNPAKALTADPRANRVVISAFILFHLVVIISGAIPEGLFLVKDLHLGGLLTTLNKALAHYSAPIGLNVGWSMFAPDPMRNNTYVDAEITYRDGRKHIWSFPQMQELGYYDRYVKERYRKFATERLWVEENSMLWPDAARYVARLNAKPSNPPQTVKLVHYWFEIPPPPPPGEQPSPEHLGRNIFFVYTVKPGDLQ